MAGPLDGIKILDLSVALTGPLATGMLCDQGAEVIKIERPPFGDQVRYVGTTSGGMTAMFQVANRGKRSMVVDLTTAVGVELVLALAAEVDVVVHNYRPGAVDRMGIDYETIAAVNPDVVYCSLSGFGQTGPYTHRRVYDTVIQAQSGLADNQRGTNDDKPIFHRQLTADKVTAYTACQAITAALFARAMGRGGQHIELSMLDANIAFLYVDGAGHEVALDGDHRGPTSASASNSALELADGYAAISPVTDAEFHGICAAFDVDSSDPGLATMADRFGNKELMSEAMRKVRAAAAKVSVEDASRRMDEAQVPYGLVLSVADVPHDAQVVANGTFFEHVHPTMGRIREPRPPALFESTPSELRGLDAPTLGQHTDEILGEVGWADRAAQLRSAKVVS